MSKSYKPTLRVTADGMVAVTNKQPTSPHSSYIQDNLIDQDALFSIMTGAEMSKFIHSDIPEKGDDIRSIGLSRGEYVLLAGKWHEAVDIRGGSGKVGYLEVKDELLLSILRRARSSIRTPTPSSTPALPPAGTPVRQALDQADKEYGRDDVLDDDIDDEEYDRHYMNYMYGRTPGATTHITPATTHVSNYKNYTAREPASEYKYTPPETPWARQPRARWSKDDRVKQTDYPAKHRLFDECDVL
jgi:hypothetical protein